MNFKHPFINFVSGLVMMLLLVFTFNLVQNGGVEATTTQETSEPVLGAAKPISLDTQYQEEEEGEDEQEEEEWDEEEGEHEHEHDDEHGEHDDEHGEHGEHEHIMLEFEENMARLEIISRLAEVAENKTKTAGYALMQLEQFVDDEGATGRELKDKLDRPKAEVIDKLNELIDSDKVSPAVKNLLKMKLVEILEWDDRREEAVEVLMSMIVEQD